MMFDSKRILSKKISFIYGIISKLNIKFYVTVICLAFLGSSIYDNFGALSDQTINVKEILWLVGGVLFTFLSIIINAYAWKLLINSIGCNNSNSLKIIKIYLNTNIYKYLPGGIWHFVSRYNLLRQKLSTQKSVESVLLEPLLMLVAGFIFIPLGSLNIYLLVICWSSTLIFLPSVRELILTRLKSIKSSIFTENSKLYYENSVQNKENISAKIFYPFKSLFVEIVFILFRFIGFLCCINAFLIGSSISQYKLISSFSLAWVIGLVVPAAPGGLGVFESVILFTLSSQLPEAPLLASLLCYRLVSTLSDIFAAIIYPIKKLFLGLKYE